MRDDILEIPGIVKQAGLDGELDACIREQCDHYGISYFLFLSSLCLESITTPELMVNNGFPDSLELPGKPDSALMDDTVVRYCRSMSSPAIWNMDGTGKITGDLIQAKASILSPAAALGVHSGILFPYHGIGSEFGLFVVCSDQAYEASGLAQPETHYVMSLLGSAIFDAHNHEKRVHIQGMRDSLTKREKECLRWASEGKTAWEVASILDVSERTVVFHLQNATKKLGAYSRSGALVKSVLYGII